MSAVRGSRRSHVDKSGANGGPDGAAIPIADAADGPKRRPADVDAQARGRLGPARRTTTAARTTSTARRGDRSPHPSIDGQRRYRSAIGRIPLLTVEQTIDLAKRIEVGAVAAEELARRAASGLRGGAPGSVDPQQLTSLAADGQRARQRFIEANLRLVVSIARRHARPGMPLADLVQEGNLGLIRAVEKWDYAKGFTFATYGEWWIRVAIYRALNEARLIQLPTYMIESINALGHVRRDMAGELGRSPTTGELAERTGLSRTRIELIMAASQLPLSLDAPTGDDDVATLAEFVANPHADDPAELAAQRWTRQLLVGMLAEFETRDRRIIALRYGLDGGQPRTLDDVGRVLGVSGERIRQIGERPG